MNLFSWQKKNHIPRNATFVLTELGKDKAENFTGDPKTRILMAIEQNGASTTDEISRLSRLTKGKVESMMPALIRGGFVQPVKGDMSEQ